MVLPIALAACAEQQTVVSYKPFLTGVAGAKFAGQQPVNPDKGRVQPNMVGPDFKSVVEHPNGTKTYVTPTPLILMSHLEALLDEGTPEADHVILDQLVDEETQQHYRRHGYDPADYVKYLHENRKQIAKTFARMPMGEHTPTIIVEQPGNRQWVLKLTDQAARDLKFTEVWIRQDMGMWRLEWLK